MKKRSLFTVLGVLIALFVISACGQDEVQQINSGGEEQTTPVAETSTPAPTPEPPVIKAVYTGLTMETEEKSRPIAVMVNNFSAARPQSGLSNADVIWEVLAEGGITRLVAIFQSTDALTDTIGPIRSNRPYLIDIADSYGAIMSHAGASTDGYAILQQRNKPYLDEISNAGPYYWRSKDRKAPHNLYSNLEKLRAGAEKKGYQNNPPAGAYLFGDQGSAAADAKAVEAKQFALTFTLKNYQVEYTYNELQKNYERSINGKPHIDKNNEQQLTATNLIVMETAHKTLDNEGRLSVDLTSGGKAILFQNGKAAQCEWVRAADGMLRWAKDGKEIELLPGKTYIHIVPNKKGLTAHITGVENWK